MRNSQAQLTREMELIEEERQRISADIHDGMGSLVTSLQQSIGSISDQLPDQLLVTRSIDLLNRIQYKLKTVSHNLVPQTLSYEGFNQAIKGLAAEASTPTVSVEMECNIEDAYFNQRKALHLFRVLQELTNNAIKHGSPTTIRIIIREDGGQIKILFSDNGRGFPPNAHLKAKNFGLQNIKSRLNLLSAVYKIHTAPGKGTSYFISIPTIMLKNE